MNGSVRLMWGPVRFVRVLALLAIAALAGCAALTRGGQSALVVASYPVHGLVTPYERTAEIVAEEETPGWARPFVYTAFAAEDLFVTLISVGDLVMTPFYAPFEVEPLDVYDFTTFPPRLNVREAREVETHVGKAVGTVVGGAVVVGVAIAAVALRHHASCHVDDWSGRCISYR